MIKPIDDRILECTPLFVELLRKVVGSPTCDYLLTEEWMLLDGSGEIDAEDVDDCLPGVGKC